MTGEIIIYKAVPPDVNDNNFCRSFRDVSFCKEIILQPLQALSLSESGSHHLMVLPIIGGVDIRDGGREGFFIGAEQFYWSPGSKEFSISNPYSKNEISCLVIGSSHVTLAKNKVESGTIDLSQKNILHTIADFHLLKFSIGIYDGRMDGNFRKSSYIQGILCYVIRGVFEVAGRLLHPKDALSFTNEESIEFEALSENAILLIVETT